MSLSTLQMCTKLYDKDEFQPLDPSQEPIFPPELIVRPSLASKGKLSPPPGEQAWFLGMHQQAVCTVHSLRTC